jgi:alpha-tubulin suppressor-like RCC1 family protein
VEALGLEDTEAVCAGGKHSCAISSTGLVRCWGENTDGQLGDGTTVQKSVPTLAEGVAGATAIGCGRQHSCAVIEDGTVMCWGSNRRGQLGFGNAWALEPQAVKVFPQL